jgi:DNA replication protein DnaC
VSDELLEKFQAIMPKCFFCQAKHGGEGYEGYRMGDVVSGVEPPDFAYICPGCQSRRAEFAEIMSNRRKDFYFRDMLRERALFDYDERFSLPNVFEDIRSANSELFAMLDQHPLPESIWIHGKYGLGKSHVSRSVGNRYVETREGAALLPGPRLRNIGEEWGLKREALFKPYCKVPLLIIDDIDKALKWTDNSLEALWTITDERANRSLRTIITSQVDPAVFFKGMERIVPGSGSFTLSILDRLKPLSVFEFQGRPRRGDE